MRSSLSATCIQHAAAKVLSSLKGGALVRRVQGVTIRALSVAGAAQGFLEHVGVPQGTRLTATEWGLLRASLGRPRRFSLTFLRQVRRRGPPTTSPQVSCAPTAALPNGACGDAEVLCES